MQEEIPFPEVHKSAERSLPTYKQHIQPTDILGALPEEIPVPLTPPHETQEGSVAG